MDNNCQKGNTWQLKSSIAYSLVFLSGIAHWVNMVKVTIYLRMRPIMGL